MSEYKLRENDHGVDGNLALWPIGSLTNEVCSWATFLQIWKSYLPNLKIKPPSLDTCHLCDEYAKYMIVKKEHQFVNLPEFLNNDPLICPATNQLSSLEKGFGDLESTRKNVCLLAAKHVKAARSQKLLAKAKFEAADRTMGVKTSKRTITVSH